MKAPYESPPTAARGVADAQAVKPSTAARAADGRLLDVRVVGLDALVRVADDGQRGPLQNRVPAREPHQD